MGELARFLNEIKKDVYPGNISFNTGFLNSAGIILEKRGFEETRLFLWDSHFRDDLERQAIVLLNVLRKMEDVDLLKKNRAISSHVIRNMDKALK